MCKDLIIRDNDFNIDKLNEVLKNNNSIKRLDLSKLHSIIFEIYKKNRNKKN